MTATSAKLCRDAVEAYDDARRSKTAATKASSTTLAGSVPSGTPATACAQSLRHCTAGDAPSLTSSCVCAEGRVILGTELEPAFDSRTSAARPSSASTYGDRQTADSTNIFSVTGCCGQGRRPTSQRRLFDWHTAGLATLARAGSAGVVSADLRPQARLRTAIEPGGSAGLDGGQRAQLGGPR